MASETWIWVFRFGVLVLLLATLLFVIAFSSANWHDNNETSYGLWKICTGAHCETFDPWDVGAFFVATQVLQCVCLSLYVLSPILHFFCYCGKRYPDTGCRTRVFDVGFTLGGTCHLSSIVVIGLLHSTPHNLSWCFKMSAAAAAIGLLGIFCVVISRTKALKKFSFKHPGSVSSYSAGVVVTNRKTFTNSDTTSFSNANTPQPQNGQVDTGYFQSRSPRPTSGLPFIVSQPATGHTYHHDGPPQSPHITDNHPDPSLSNTMYQPARGQQIYDQTVPKPRLPTMKQ